MGDFFFNNFVVPALLAIATGGLITAGILRWLNGNGGISSDNSEPSIKKGKRGGRYTEDMTKDGRPYRRYF